MWSIPAKNGMQGTSSDEEKLFLNKVQLQDNWWILPGRVFFFSFSFKTELNQKNVWFLLLVKGAGFALTKEAQDCEMSWGELIFLSDEALQYPEFLHIWVPVPVM